MKDRLVIHPDDNVAVALVAICDVPAGHKLALRDIRAGEPVRKYGAVIGRATRDIKAGEWVHTHNLATALSGVKQYEYRPKFSQNRPKYTGSFQGYLRADGRVGTRNELWIIPTVGCVGTLAQTLASNAKLPVPVHAFPHPYGCSQLGEDHERTQRLLAALVRHPNAGGVLVLGLGCENNHIGAFRKVLGDVDERRVKFLSAQDVPDEMETGMRLLSELAETMQSDVRTEQPLAKLVLGLKCGGSDGYSGITANPLLGRVSDGLCAAGGSALLTEVPEMFGAEELLFERCENEAVFDKAVALVNGFKAYYERHGQPVYENPSPGNKAGGITTLEEKSLGCTQKGGTGVVRDVLQYAERVKTPGLSLVEGPGNDLCAVTALCAAGAQVILFTTGRGTPLGAPAPVIKVATNKAIYARKRNWLDFCAEDGDEQALFSLLMSVASGAETKAEQNGCREIAIFKDGVTL